MANRISIELDKDVWMMIVGKMLESKIPSLEMAAKTITTLIIIQEKLNGLKEKAKI